MYLDPPYVLSTRVRKQYRYEMTDEDHEILLHNICNTQAKVMISGYDCKLYQRYLHGWRKEQIKTRAQNTSLRTETIWMNY